MAIDNFPAALQPIIQQGFLERMFQDSLRAKLGFRAVADREEFPVRVGETLTKTRAGLIAVSTTPLDPTTNTNFDNGMTATSWGVEQYTLTLQEYGVTLNLNTVTDRVGIASQFVRNAINLGENAARTLDTLARDALFGTYLGGNTRVTATLGSPGTVVAVDDIRGFQNVFVNGVITPVSGSHTMAVAVYLASTGALTNSYTLTAATADVSNVSTAPNGVSGTLTFSGNVTVADGTVNNGFVAATAPTVLRPFASSVMRPSTAKLVAGDTLQMVAQVLAATSVMRDNNVPDIDGYYHCFLSNTQLQGLFSDADFKLLFRGAYGSEEYRAGTIINLLGTKFIPVNIAPQQTLGGLKVQRGIVCGRGALIEGDFAGQDAEDVENELHLKNVVDGITMITRTPMDRLAEIIAQSWKWVGGFTVPSDTTANPTMIPTANNSAYKRAIVLESL